ncbi:TetR/AcrR family transcriptional regulator [Paenibacillus illinoisensis]|uniref:TetR/AcrR family transcriptional regulator n=1 Tax=Paenibacillus illinoisensis TaxID=59845 RepID=UPI000FDCC45C|nr:TetR/AcrR family transcriptional regulator [Paenibacillus illinoisensis]
MTPKNLFSEIQLPQKLSVKQERIIKTAIQLFAEKGYSNTATAEIAKVAGVSEASIFKQYGTKENLLLTLIIPYLKDFFPSMADTTLSRIMNISESFEDFLSAFLKNRTEFISQNKEIFQVLVKEIIYKEELKNELIPYFSEVIFSRLAKVIETFKERGELIDMPTERILMMLSTFIGGFFASNFVLLNKSSIHDDEIEEAVRFVMSGIKGLSTEIQTK